MEIPLSTKEKWKFEAKRTLVKNKSQSNIGEISCCFFFFGVL